MNDNHDTTGGPTRIVRTLARWDNHRTPDDGPPDSEDTAVFWSDENGEITDEARIAELERLYETQE